MAVTKCMEGKTAGDRAGNVAIETVHVELWKTFGFHSKQEQNPKDQRRQCHSLIYVTSGTVDFDSLYNL